MSGEPTVIPRCQVSESKLLPIVRSNLLMPMPIDFMNSPDSDFGFVSRKDAKRAKEEGERTISIKRTLINRMIGAGLLFLLVFARRMPRRIRCRLGTTELPRRRSSSS